MLEVNDTIYHATLMSTVLFIKSKQILLHQVVTFSAVFKSILCVQKPHCEFTKLTLLIKTVLYTGFFFFKKSTMHNVALKAFSKLVSR